MYDIREVIVKNGPHERSVWVIDFEDPSMDIIGEFLMTDASMMDYQVLDELNDVLSGTKSDSKFNGNRCILHINGQQTKIEDLFVGLFDDFHTFESCKINTEELRDLIVLWRKQTKAE